MARSPTPTSTGTVLLQPQASPVDTFVSPGRNGLQELASALATLNPEIQETFALRTAEQKKEEAARLEADFFRTNGEGLAEGVRQGIIPAHHSRDYARAYKALQGDALARRIEAGWLPAYDRWEGKNSDDPAAFDGFMQTYIRSNVGTEDPDILAGVGARLRQFGGEAFEAHTRYRSGEVRRQALTANLAAVNSTLDDAYHDGLASGTGTDLTRTGDDIERQRAAYIATGGSGADFDANGMKLIAAKAVELEDPDLLSFFDRTVPGEKYTYGDTPDGGLIRAEAEEKIAVRQRQAIVEGDRSAEKERRAREEAATEAAIEALSIGAAVPEEVLAAGQRANPRFRTFIGEWRDNLSKGERDPQLMRQIQADVMSGKGMAAVMEAAEHIRSPEDMKEAITFAKSFEGSRPSVDDVLGSSAMRTTLGAIETRTKASGDIFNPITGTTDEGLEAQFDLRMMMTRWAVENPDASALERDKAIAEASRLILDRMKPSPNDPAVSVYDRDPAAVGGFANPYTGMSEARDAANGGGVPAANGTGSALPPSMGAAGAAGGMGIDPAAADPKDTRSDVDKLRDAGAKLGSMVLPEGITTPEQADYFGRFSPEEQETLKESARRTGKPIGAALDHLRAKGYQPKAALPSPATSPSGAAAPDGTPIDPISFNPSEAPSTPVDLPFLSSRAIGGAQRPDSLSGMRPEFASGVEAMIRGAPPEIASGLQIMSGYRSPERQAELWKAALRKYGSASAARKWVAPPGRSGHNHGHAADLAFNGKRLDRAPASIQKCVHENAARFGLAFPLGNEAWHVELAGARGGSGRGAGGRRTFTPKDAESFLSAAMSLDPLDLQGTARDEDGAAFVPGDVAASRLLDLIGQNESAGNYNAVFGNAGASRDLGKFSVNEIIRQQTASKRRGAGSTAIGKYQFLKKTLVGLKDELGLTGEEGFTPELQDRLALHLLERRGYSAFKAGKLSRRQFARRLSQEWSSVENPGTGRSYYAGDGFHGRAPTKSQQVYAALGFAA